MNSFIVVFLLLIPAAFGAYFLMKRRGVMLLGHDAVERERSMALGVWPVGASFPAFSFPGLNGSAVRLEDFQGKKVLVVHWNPDCGFCRMISPDLARVKNLQVLLLAYGSEEENRALVEEHKWSCAVGLLDGASTPAPFEVLGTPMAYLLDKQGVVSEPLAEGAEEVLELASKAAGGLRLRPLGSSHLVRDGLKAGAHAPEFCLPTVTGGMIALEDYNGVKVLLVFTDPECEPCHELASELGRFERKHRNQGLAFLMVTRGDAEANRIEAAERGVDFPVLLQAHWKLSKEYGIFATPSAFLIGEDRRIEQEVAVGIGPVLAVAQSGVRKARAKIVRRRVGPLTLER